MTGAITRSGSRSSHQRENSKGPRTWLAWVAKTWAEPPRDRLEI